MGVRTGVIAVVVGLLAIGEAALAGWDPRDIAAAEGYQKAERERAERYRGEVQSRAPTPAPPPRRAETRRPETRAANRRGTPPRSHAEPGWLEWAISTVTGEFDRQALTGVVHEIEAWLSWWNEEAAPRIHEWTSDRYRFARDGESHDALPFTRFDLLAIRGLDDDLREAEATIVEALELGRAHAPRRD
jgi:hypothetical protein